jgi:hypothetical protein
MSGHIVSYSIPGLKTLSFYVLFFWNTRSSKEINLIISPPASQTKAFYPPSSLEPSFSAAVLYSYTASHLDDAIINFLPNFLLFTNFCSSLFTLYFVKVMQHKILTPLRSSRRH